jgi:hypothetical protein
MGCPYQVVKITAPYFYTIQTIEDILIRTFWTFGALMKTIYR